MQKSSLDSNIEVCKRDISVCLWSSYCRSLTLCLASYHVLKQSYLMTTVHFALTRSSGPLEVLKFAFMALAEAVLEEQLQLWGLHEEMLGSQSHLTGVASL